MLTNEETIDEALASFDCTELVGALLRRHEETNGFEFVPREDLKRLIEVARAEYEVPKVPEPFLEEFIDTPAPPAPITKEELESRLDDWIIGIACFAVFLAIVMVALTL